MTKVTHRKKNGGLFVLFIRRKVKAWLKCLGLCLLINISIVFYRMKAQPVLTPRQKNCLFLPCPSARALALNAALSHLVSGEITSTDNNVAAPVVDASAAISAPAVN